MNIEAPKPALTFPALEKTGFRVASDLLRVQGEKTIGFEMPVRLNNMHMHLDTSCRIGAYSYLRGGILKGLKSIGRYCSIGPYVIIGEAEHPGSWLSTSPAFYAPIHFRFGDTRPDDEFMKRTEENDPSLIREPVEIGNDVWIGANVIIRRGVKIGDGAIIGASSLVLNDVEPYAVMTGTPAKLRRHRFDRPLISDLQAIKWWEFDAPALSGIPFDDPSAAIREIVRREAAGEIARMKPKFRRVILSNSGCKWPEPKPV